MALSCGGVLVFTATLLIVGVWSECLPTTAPDAEGPYYLPDAPFQYNLTTECADLGTHVGLYMSGRVLSECGTPLANAIVDAWAADDDGEYDLVGFCARGRVVADELGAWAFYTVYPGAYGGDTPRPEHIHVKVTHDGYEATSLTTQMYFPSLDGEPNDSTSRAVSVVLREDGSFEGTFDFVLAAPSSAASDCCSSPNDSVDALEPGEVYAIMLVVPLGLCLLTIFALLSWSTYSVGEIQRQKALDRHLALKEADKDVEGGEAAPNSGDAEEDSGSDDDGELRKKAAGKSDSSSKSARGSGSASGDSQAKEQNKRKKSKDNKNSTTTTTTTNNKKKKVNSSSYSN